MLVTVEWTIIASINHKIDQKKKNTFFNQSNEDNEYFNLNK